jgi:hypothetical protein
MRIAEETYKTHLADVSSQLEAGVPEDAKKLFEDYQKLKFSFNEAKIKAKKEVELTKAQLAKYLDVERKQTALTLAQRYSVDVNTLETFSDVKEMKAYALDNMDLSKLTPKPENQPEADKTNPVSKLPPVSSPTQKTGGGSDESFMRDYAEGRSNDHARYLKIIQKR